MKKIYALAAVACMAMAANAQNGAPLYITGDGADMDYWTPATTSVFTYADGVYTFESKNLTSFKISTAVAPVPEEGAAADWATFEAGCLCVEGTIENKVPANLVAGNANINCPWLGDYTITVAGDLSTITLSTETPQPGGAPTLYFRGDMNEWGNPDDWKLEVVSNEELVYKFVCDDEHAVLAGQSFKIATEPWGVCNLGANPESDNPELIVPSTVEIDALSPLFKGDNPPNLSLAENWRGVMYLKVDLTANSAGTFVIFCADKDAENPFGDFGAVNDITVENNSEAAYYTLQGVRVAEPANGLYIVVKDGKATKVIR